jgi:hypothetical protein
MMIRADGRRAQARRRRRHRDGRAPTGHDWTAEDLSVNTGTEVIAFIL